MAKVNRKFLFVLTGGILGAVVLVVAVKKIAFKSPEENVREAQAFADKGDYGAAAIYVGKAVSKEQANVEYLTTWRDYLLKYAPKDQTRASDAFTKLRSALTQLAVVQRVNVKAQRELLDVEWSVIEGIGEYANYSALSGLIAQTEQMLSYHEGSPDGDWQTLERYRGWALTNMTVASQDTKQQLIDQAKKSLDIAAKADPKDVRTALKTEELYWTLARRAAVAGSAASKDAAGHRRRSSQLVCEHRHAGSRAASATGGTGLGREIGRDLGIGEERQAHVGRQKLSRRVQRDSKALHARLGFDQVERDVRHTACGASGGSEFDPGTGVTSVGDE